MSQPAPEAESGATSPTGDVAIAFIAKSRSLLSTEYLPKIERCVNLLTDEQIWWRPNPESNSVGNLLLHLAGNVRQWIVCGLGGAVDFRERQQEFDQRSVIPGEELLSKLKNTLAEVDTVLAGVDGVSLLQRRTIQGCDVMVLDAIYHVVEHFSMHAGQIILLAKAFTNNDLKFYDFSSGAPASTLEE